MFSFFFYFQPCTLQRAGVAFIQVIQIEIAVQRGLVMDAFPGGRRPSERGQAVNTAGIKSQDRTGLLLRDCSQTV